MDGISVADNSNSISATAPLPDEVKARIARNRESALGKLQATLNRRATTAAVWRLRAANNRLAALHKLQNKFIYRAKYPQRPLPTSSTIPTSIPSPNAISTSPPTPSTLPLTSTATMTSRALDSSNKPPPPQSDALDLVPSSILDVKLIYDLKQTLSSRSAPLDGNWKLLDCPGLALKNSLNKCWFHAGLHFLSTIPALRLLCTSPSGSMNQFDRRFLKAIRAIVLSQRPSDVGALFPSVCDFGGRQYRYGQKSVPDFFEHLFVMSSFISRMLKFTFSSKLTCANCHWISERLCDEVSAKLHLPPGKSQIHLYDLVDYNFNTTLCGTDAVFCGNCRIKTSQQQRQSLNPDMSYRSSPC